MALYHIFYINPTAQHPVCPIVCSVYKQCNDGTIYYLLVDVDRVACWRVSDGSDFRVLAEKYNKLTVLSFLHVVDFLKLPFVQHNYTQGVLAVTLGRELQST